jgi:tetratricopeptide (TPR) repeat protein
MDGSRGPARDTSAGVGGDNTSQLSGEAGNVVQARDVTSVHFHTSPRPTEPGPPGPPVPRQLPRIAGDFVGRAKDLARLDALLTGTGPGPDHGPGPRSGAFSSGAAVCAVTGTAGVGKTALALHWAHRRLDRFPDGQLYLDLRGYGLREPVAPEQALERFLRDLDYTGALPHDLDGKAALYRTLLAERRMLVLLDNACDVDQIRPLLPGAGPSAVVITSRNALAGLVARDGAHRLILDTLTEAAAVELLRTLTKGCRRGDEARELADLASLCAYLPLALRLAGERATTHPYMTLADLTADLRRRWAIPGTASDADPDPRPGEGTKPWAGSGADADAEPQAFSTVLAWSYRTLPAEDARMFRLLGLHPGTDIAVPAAAVLADTDSARARRQLDFLVESHLLEHSAPGRYRFHSLLRAYAAELLRREEPGPRRRAALERTLDWYLRGAQAAGSLLATRPARHAPPGARAPGTEPPAFANTSSDPDPPRSTGTPHPRPSPSPSGGASIPASSQSGSTHAAGPPPLGGAGTATPLPPGGMPDPASSPPSSSPPPDGTPDPGPLPRDGAPPVGPSPSGGTNFAHPTPFDGATDAAAWLDAEWPNLLAAVRAAAEAGLDEIAARLPLALRAAPSPRGRHAEAMAAGSTGLAAARRLGDRRLEAALLEGLALSSYENGSLAESRDLHTAVLALRRDTGDRAGEIASLCELGRVAHRRRRFKQALGYFQQAIEILLDTEADRPWIAHAVGLAGQAYGELGHLGEAAELTRQALDLWRILGDGPREAETLCRLARIQRLQDCPDAATRTALLALSVLRDRPEPAAEAAALLELAAACLAAGDHAVALRWYEQASAAYRHLGDAGGEAAARDGMGRALYALGRRAEAARLHRRAADALRELGDPWPLAIALDHLATVHYQAGDLKAAQTHWQEAQTLLARFDDPPAAQRGLRIRAKLEDPFARFRSPDPGADPAPKAEQEL